MGGLSIWSVSLLKRFFCGEGVPPSHVWVGKGVLEILGGRGGCVVHTSDGCSHECEGGTPTPRKVSRGWTRIGRCIYRRRTRWMRGLVYLIRLVVETFSWGPTKEGFTTVVMRFVPPIAPAAGPDRRTIPWGCRGRRIRRAGRTLSRISRRFPPPAVH